MKLIGLIMTFIYLLQGAVMTGQSIMGGPIGGVLKTLCFKPSTIIKLKSGEKKQMKNAALGDVLENGSEVIGVLKLKGHVSNPYYKIWSSKLNDFIYVTGEHKILPKNINHKNCELSQFIKVEDCDYAEKTNETDKEYSCLITDDHKIPIGEHIFWDWED